MPLNTNAGAMETTPMLKMRIQQQMDGTPKHQTCRMVIQTNKGVWEYTAWGTLCSIWRTACIGTSPDDANAYGILSMRGFV